MTNAVHYDINAMTDMSMSLVQKFQPMIKYVLERSLKDEDFEQYLRAFNTFTSYLNDKGQLHRNSFSSGLIEVDVVRWLEACTLVCEALNHIDAGRLVETKYGMRPFCLGFILKTAASDEIIRYSLMAVAKALRNDGGGYPQIKRYDTPQLHAAIEYLVESY